jgi:hypothetical protein
VPSLVQQGHRAIKTRGVAERTESGMKLFRALQVLAQVQRVTCGEVAMYELADGRFLMAWPALQIIRALVIAYDVTNALRAH